MGTVLKDYFQSVLLSLRTRMFVSLTCILVPRSRSPFGQHQESRPLARSNTGSPRFTDFPSLCAWSESSLTNLIGSSLNLLCLKSHSEPESHWTYPVVMILGADRKERDLLGRECLAREMWIDVIHYEPHILSLRLLNFFSTVFLFLERQSCFVKLYQKERSIELHTHNGGWHETLKLLHISDVLHESKKKVNKLLRVRSTDWK